MFLSLISRRLQFWPVFIEWFPMQDISPYYLAFLLQLYSSNSPVIGRVLLVVYLLCTVTVLLSFLSFIWYLFLVSKPLNSFSSTWKLHNLSDCALPAISAYSCLSSPKYMMYCRHFKPLKLLWYCKVNTFFIWFFFYFQLDCKCLEGRGYISSLFSIHNFLLWPQQQHMV